jgi:hypothetical protein
MKKFKFKNKEYKICTSWDEVTLEQQIKVSEDSREFNTEATKIIALLSGYSGIPIDVLKHSTPKEVGRLMKHLAFIKEPIPDKIVTSFVFNNETYNVSQNLLEQEFQDYISLEAALSNNENDIYKSLPLIIAILAKKNNESLDDYNVEERAEEFKQLPISIANGISVFFYTVGRLSLINSQLYSDPKKLIQKKQDELESSLKRRGGGLLRYLYRKVSLTYIKYLRRNLKL